MKHAIVQISMELIIAMATRDESPAVIVTEHALPADATIVGCVPHFPNGRCIECIVESATFADIPIGTSLPTLPPVRFRRVTQGAQ